MVWKRQREGTPSHAGLEASKSGTDEYKNHSGEADGIPHTWIAPEGDPGCSH
jgi:hypothetical protein